MLYDPKWEKQSETKANPFSLAAFIAWLETKSPNGEYSYEDCDGGCLLGQFAANSGVSWGDLDYTHLNNIEVGNTDYGLIAAKEPHTFGAALDRARAASRSL